MVSATLSVIFTQESRDTSDKRLQAITADNYGFMPIGNEQWIVLDDGGDLYLYNLTGHALYKRYQTDTFEIVSSDAYAEDIVLEKTVMNKTAMMSLLSDAGVVKHGYFYKK